MQRRTGLLEHLVVGPVVACAVGEFPTAVFSAAWRSSSRVVIILCASSSSVCSLRAAASALSVAADASDSCSLDICTAYTPSMLHHLYAWCYAQVQSAVTSKSALCCVSKKRRQVAQNAEEGTPLLATSVAACIAY